MRARSLNLVALLLLSTGCLKLNRAFDFDTSTTGSGSETGELSGTESGDPTSSWGSGSDDGGADGGTGSSGGTSGTDGDTTGGTGGSTGGTDSSGSVSGTTSTTEVTTSDPGTTSEPSEKVVARPASVLECGAGFVDEEDHQVGDQYSMTADDLRTGTCGPDPCTLQGKTELGLDLEFSFGLDPGITIQYAELYIRGIPNNGDPGTTWIYDYETDALLGSCVIDRPQQEYGDCAAVLDHAYLEPESTRIYTDNDDPACYFVYDYFEITIAY